MRRSKLLGLVFMTMLALTSIGAATAAAESLPNILPLGEKEHPLESQSKSGKSTFGSGLEEIVSEKSKDNESGTSEKLGTFHVTFEEVKSVALGQCQGVGDVAGIVLVLGQFHVRDAKENGNLIVVILFLLENVLFTCGAGKVPITVEGCVAGQVTPTTLTNTLTVTLALNGKDNLIVTVLNEANTAEEACQLLASVNGGATVLSSQKQTATLENFTKEAKAVQVLVMEL